MRVSSRWRKFSTCAVLTLAVASPSLAASRRDPTLVFVGDISLAGKAQRLIARAGPAAPFVGVAPILQRADLAAGNLECPLSTRGRPLDEKTYTFRGRPGDAAALRVAGLNVVTLANNHTGDFGRVALLDTLDACRNHGLLTVGAGRDLQEAGAPVLLSRGEPPQTIALLAFSNMFPLEFYATSQRAGTNPARLARVKAQVKAARARADIVVVLFHFGDELSSTPSRSQRLLAHAAIDAGADLVVGHHPHVLQGLERYRGGLIAYSLGNFLFSSQSPGTHDTALLSYTRSPDGRVRVQLLPCRLVGVKPFVAEGQARTRLLAHLTRLSRALGTTLPITGRLSWHSPPR